MTIISLPDIAPTRRRFEPGEWAVKRYNSISGAGHSRLYGSRPFDATFELEYICDDINAETFIQAWHQSKGGYYDISIPRGLVAGIKTQLVWVLPQNLSWRFESRPSVESMRPDVNKVRVNLIGRLEIERQGIKKGILDLEGEG